VQFIETGWYWYYWEAKIFVKSPRCLPPRSLFDWCHCHTERTLQFLASSFAGRSGETAVQEAAAAVQEAAAAAQAAAQAAVAAAPAQAAAARFDGNIWRAILRNADPTGVASVACAGRLCREAAEDPELGPHQFRKWTPEYCVSPFTLSFMISVVGRLQHHICRLGCTVCQKSFLPTTPFADNSDPALS
jgi:hypothetical protein